MMTVGLLLFRGKDCYDSSLLVFSTKLPSMEWRAPPKQNATVPVSSKPSRERKSTVPLAPHNSAKMPLQPKAPHLFGSSFRCLRTV